MYCNSFEGQVSTNATSTAGSTGTSEQTLMSFSLPANSLYKAGQAIRVRAVGAHAANSNSVTWKLYIGATSISSGASTTSGEVADLNMLLTFLAAASETAIASGKLGTTNLATAITAATDDATAAILVKLTATGTTTGADAIAKLLQVEFLQNP